MSPVFATNGGLSGAKRTTTTSSAPGVWMLEEQAVAKRAGIWPQVITDPTAGLSPVLWYDFADESTVTTSSGQITQITDKGSANRTLTKSATGPTYATTINSKKVSDWGTSTHSNYLRSSSTASLTVAELYIIADSSATGSVSGYAALITSLSNTNIYLNVTGSGFEGPYGIDRVYLNGGTTNQFSDIFPEIESPCLLRANKSDLTAITTTNGFQLGMDRDNADRGWRGLIAEVICFSSVLGSTDRDSLQAWLAFKWGITLV
jgi:hypothetical protein